MVIADLFLVGIRSSTRRSCHLHSVMRGLDPRIHPLARASGDMDRRVKPGDDSGEMTGQDAPYHASDDESFFRSLKSDRTSGVEGKAVSVRLNFGGRRHTKKKRQHKY